MTGWTDEMVAILRAGHASGASFGEIAADIGNISRNAVIGKARRLGLDARVQVTRRTTFRSKPITQTAPPQNQEEPVDPVRLLSLRPHHCRYPVEGEGAATLFCGATKHGTHSYCLKHCQIAYRDYTPTEKTLGRVDDTAHQGARA